MNTKRLIVSEFERRVFNESYVRIFKCLTLLSESQVWQQPTPHIPPVGNLVLHLCGNARQWVLSGLGGQLDNRHRDLEFQSQPNIRKAELIFLLENLRVNLRQTVRDLPPEILQQRLLVQGFEETGFSVLVHVIEHFSYHTGQITTLTKWLTDQETGYYHGLNLNQLN